MSNTDTHHWYDLTTHRPWEDFVSAIIGAAVILAPIVIEVTDSTWALVSIGATGTLIVALAMLENVSWRRWEEMLEALAGAWLIASPFVFGYGGMEATFHIVAGALVMFLGALEYWQDRGRTA
ncbi:MAG: SPW repeat protein [Oricola sp.]